MKSKNYSLLVLTAAVIFAACGTDTSGNDATVSPNTPGIQNVNGNLPDTSNTIELNSSQPVDSISGPDSVKLNF